jgi:hypothetical protein
MAARIAFGKTQRFISNALVISALVISALVIVQVFAGNIIFGYLARANFTLIGIS